MANDLLKLKDKLSAKVIAKANEKAAEMLVEMNLAKLRQSKCVTQNDIAHTLAMTQPSVAQLEKRGDTYISTLRSYLQALGGELELVVKFPDGTRIHINQFDRKRG